MAPILASRVFVRAAAVLSRPNEVKTCVFGGSATRKHGQSPGTEIPTRHPLDRAIFGSILALGGFRAIPGAVCAVKPTGSDADRAGWSRARLLPPHPPYHGES